ncbi:transcription initiation factor TFIID subunit 5-like, partial [Lingula anatina]
MSRESYTQLKRYLQEKKQALLLNIIQERLFIDVYDGLPRTKQQIDVTSGGMSGEARREANKSKVLYGLLKEPDINISLDDDDDADGEDKDKPKKKKQKKDLLSMKKSKNDPNAPSNTRIPLPELKDTDKIEKANAYKEALKRVKITQENKPSICFYTLLNSYENTTSIEISEDSSILSAGFSDAVIKVWSTTPNKLRCMKTGVELDMIDKDVDDVLERMMDDRTASEYKTLCGHSGPVYSTSLSMDKNFLVSSSEDGT